MEADGTQASGDKGGEPETSQRGESSPSDAEVPDRQRTYKTLVADHTVPAFGITLSKCHDLNCKFHRRNIEQKHFTAFLQYNGQRATSMQMQHDGMGFRNVPRAFQNLNSTLSRQRNAQ